MLSFALDVKNESDTDSQLNRIMVNSMSLVKRDVIRYQMIFLGDRKWTKPTGRCYYGRLLTTIPAKKPKKHPTWGHLPCRQWYTWCVRWGIDSPEDGRPQNGLKLDKSCSCHTSHLRVNSANRFSSVVVVVRLAVGLSAARAHTSYAASLIHSFV